MKIYLSQINTIVGDVEHNYRRVLKEMERARGVGADLIVFPELTLLGYPPRDLVLRKDLIDDNLTVLEKISAQTQGIGVIVGYVDRNPATEGKGLFNAAALCADGKVLSRHFKTLLPTYDIFDEARYFDPAPSVHTVLFRGKRIGITICEDIWNVPPHGANHRLYKIDPVKELTSQMPDLIINISAAPFALDKRKIREDVVRETALRAGAPVLHVNLVGGNDSVIFDGWSAVFDSEGRLVANSRDFEEDAILYDMERGEGERRPTTAIGAERLFAALKLGLADYVRKCGFEKTVLGLSGGIDSALVAVISAQALGPDRVVGVSMASRFSSQGSRDDAAELAHRLGIEYIALPIEGPFETFLELLKPQFQGTSFNIAEENIQARIRGTLLMALSNKFGWLVLSTGNKSELAMGYCTLYGD
ncbi:MAG: NAD(+) synthase, partial [Candidatus Sumerlaeota bacterium]|nr:NAD(+) synthase [Candidatus Sumerlaeota bacterium]